MNVRLNNKYLFDNFVVGPCNQFSHAACLQVISSPAYSYNPLFIHGRSGLGKTHLLQATCRSIISRNPSVRVLYISCEDFINEFIASLKDGSLPSFRKRLRLLDCLFVDDIHFLARKKRMQEEFFHTFNALYDNQKQIVLSSDSKPHDMAHFEDRLLTRFQWGLMTSIDPPSLETRQVIAEQKANALDQRLPGCVSEYLARIVHRNVRELEGAVIKLIATARMLGRPIDLDLAKGALSDIAPPKVRTPGFSEIASAVANHYGISVSDLQSPRRLRALVVPRQISMYMIKSLTRSSLKEIGTYFGGRDHSTVLHALNQTEKLIKSDRGVKTCVRDLMAGFYASASV